MGRSETPRVLDAMPPEPVDAPGWPPPEAFPVSECLLVVLNEEYLHRLYAERDLAELRDFARTDDEQS